MAFYVSLVLVVILAEVLRRCCRILLQAFTGPLSKVPGPFWMKISALPWHLIQIRGSHLKDGPKLFAKYGPVVRITPKAVIVTGKNEIRKILVEDDWKKGPDYDLINASPHVTTLFTERDKTAYKQKRRMMSLGFSIAYLNGLEASMHECVQVLEDELNSVCSKVGGFAVVDMSNYLKNLGSDVLSATVMGESLGLVRSNDTKLGQIFLERTGRSALYSNFPFLKYLPFMPPVVAPEWDRMVDEIVAKRRAVPKDQRKKDLLQMFLDTNEQNPDSFAEDVLREEIQLFMLAGSDTTSFTATAAILLLLNNPDKLETLIEEVDTAFPRKDDPVEFHKTQGLPYLNAVIDETMRLMPVAGSGLPRETTEPTTIHGLRFSPGTILYAWVSHPMKDERFFPDPKSFIPERWLGEYKGVEADRKAFLPFSAGSRNCIGQQYALRELRMVLVTLLRRFELILVPGQSHEIQIQITPHFESGKYMVGVRPRAA